MSVVSHTALRQGASLPFSFSIFSLSYIKGHLASLEFNSYSIASVCTSFSYLPPGRKRKLRVSF